MQLDEDQETIVTLKAQLLKWTTGKKMTQTPATGRRPERVKEKVRQEERRMSGRGRKFPLREAKHCEKGKENKSGAPEPGRNSAKVKKLNKKKVTMSTSDLGRTP
jgi:hypothetical protein